MEAFLKLQSVILVILEVKFLISCPKKERMKLQVNNIEPLLCVDWQQIEIEQEQDLYTYT